MKTNFQLILDRELQRITAAGRTPSLLLHSCCGPCSSYVLEYLSRYFRITVLFYNPNIDTGTEYARRAAEQQRLIREMPFPNPVSLITADYDAAPFYAAAKGLEHAPEGGARCTECFRLRLETAAEYAARGQFDYFTTTLSVSPHKNAQLLNELGMEIAGRHGVSYLQADFKKREGYKRSIQLSAEYDLYRQDYCGCVFSRRAENA